VSAAGVIEHAPGAEPDAELADALATIERLERVGRIAGTTDAADYDLVITSLPSTHRGNDEMAVRASHLLRVGGIFAVLTHCDWTRGSLTDPTGSVVTAAQNADLLYLQHIVAVHAPIRDGAFVVELSDPIDDEYVLAEHRAAVRGLPAPHRRTHSDVLVFAQPHVPEPACPVLAASAFETGVLR
jgi:hypothetical protein